MAALERDAETSFRHAVLHAARQFKSNWFDLARQLVKVRNEELFAVWGYDSFESYCAKELHIRRQTALKLTRSYSFLHKHEPRRAAAEDAGERAPAVEVVEVLAQAEERGQLSGEEYRTIREAIWDPERPPLDLKRELTTRFPRPPADQRSALTRLAQTARRLAAELRGLSDVPRGISERAAALADELEGLFAAQVDRQRPWDSADRPRR
jgi:hypothetical protein